MKLKEHCDFYLAEDYLNKAKRGDCVKPVNGRFKPHKCEGICARYDDTAYRFKLGFIRGFDLTK